MRGSLGHFFGNDNVFTGSKATLGLSGLLHLVNFPPGLFLGSTEEGKHASAGFQAGALKFQEKQEAGGGG